MKWNVGKGARGHIAKADDGDPIWYVSECGNYTVSRAYTPQGWRWDAWHREFDDKGRLTLPTQLGAGLSTRVAAEAACIHHATTAETA